MTWKGYFQSLPPAPATYVKTGPGANGPYTFKYPSSAHAFYASKHNPFVNFTGTQDAIANMVDRQPSSRPTSRTTTLRRLQPDRAATSATTCTAPVAAATPT